MNDFLLALFKHLALSCIAAYMTTHSTLAPLHLNFRFVLLIFMATSSPVRHLEPPGKFYAKLHSHHGPALVPLP